MTTFCAVNLVVFGLLIFTGSFSKAAVLVNDFSGAVSGYNFTDSLNDYYGNSAPSAHPGVIGLPGQVDLGFYTVDFRDTDPFTVGAFSIVNGYAGDMGGWSGSGGFYTGGTYFDLEGVQGFYVSLRREALNTAGTINLYILTNQDLEYYFPILTASLSSAQFTDVYVPLDSNSGYTFISGLGAVQIGIKGDFSNPSSTYNFSVDSLRVLAVPEPSSAAFYLVGFVSWLVGRRRDFRK